MLISTKAVTHLWSVQNVRCLSTTNERLRGFVKSTTVNLTAEARQRLIDRKKRRLAKLEKRPVRKIPIVDFIVIPEWTSAERKRTLDARSEEESEARILIQKSWARYTKQLRYKEEVKVESLMKSQRVALKELYNESLELFTEAIKCDPSLFPFTCGGPVQTLPIEGYLAPLGGYIEQAPDNSTDEDDEMAMKILENF